MSFKPTLAAPVSPPTDHRHPLHHFKARATTDATFDRAAQLQLAQDHHANVTSSRQVAPSANGPVQSRAAPRRAVKDPNLDDIREAATRDVLKEEAARAHAQKMATPSASASISLSAASPPRSASSELSPGAASPPVNAHAIAPRNASIDSTMSNVSSTTLFSQRSNGTSHARASPEATGPQDAGSLIVAAGSAEAAIAKLVHEKSQATSHNAQLWRLVEKQRAMILGLNKDLEKSLKEKERYRRKLKDQLAQSISAASLTGQINDDRGVDKSSPAPRSSAHDNASNNAVALREASSSGRKVSDASDVTSSGTHSRSNTPQDVTGMLLSGFPATPRSGVPEHTSQHLTSRLGPRENTAVNLLSTAAPPGTPLQVERGTTAMSPQSFSSPKQGNRKAPPAPLQLSTVPGPVRDNVIDASDSEYEDDPDSARAEQMLRGRRKTREEDDRDREIAAMHDVEARSRSKKEKKRVINVSENTRLDLTHSRDDLPAALDPPVQEIRQHPAVASLLSPGLPMSPRPGDRPMNSPLPRAPGKALNTMPLSPKVGIVGLPLSPRAPKHPIPLPTGAVPFPPSQLSRSGGFQHSGITDTRSTSSPDASPDKELPNHQDLTNQGEIYTGLVSDEYPDLLLPPHALPSILIQTASSRMRPSRQSYIAPRAGDENPVLTLAVFARSDQRQLWRVEKSLAALASFDTQIKVASTFRDRFPDKSLFAGHAPAKIDARRSAVDQYFDRLLEYITEDRAATLVCKFISTDAIGAEGRSDYFGTSPVDSRPDTPVTKSRAQRAGYLTKRGKNFGGWKARYFVLDGPSLRYFEAPGGAHLGSIKLQNAQIGKQSQQTGAGQQEEEDNQFRHAFLILEPKKKDSSSLVRHVLCAENDEERDAWVDALLQYVDFKEEEDQARLHSGIKHDVAGPRTHRAGADSKSSSSKHDPLLSVSYSETIAGEAPVIGPSTSRKPETPSPASEDGLANHPTISGPTNLTMIQNAGEWGMKAPATPSAKEFSKDKKRGMFSAFRGRSSSDLAPEKGSSIGGGFADTHGRPIFGMPLAEAVDCSQTAGEGIDLPIVVYRCMQFLTAKNAALEEGIFRLSGSNTVIKSIKDRFNAEGDVDLMAESDQYDIHAVASLLKLYLRELPASILTRELHLEFLQCLEMQAEEKNFSLNQLVGQLPPCNRALLHALATFLLSIVSNAEVNKMNLRNVGIVFAPTLNVPGPLISSFVEDHGVIFGPPLEPVGSKKISQNLAATPQSNELRSPRKQMFSDLPTPAYHQTAFQTFETGMIPMQPSYHQPDNGLSARSRRRESGMMFLGSNSAPQKKPSMSRLREEEHAGP